MFFYHRGMRCSPEQLKDHKQLIRTITEGKCQCDSEEKKTKKYTLGTFHSGGKKVPCAMCSDMKESKEFMDKKDRYVSGIFQDSMGKKMPAYLSKYEVAPEAFYPSYPEDLAVAYRKPSN